MPLGGRTAVGPSGWFRDAIAARTAACRPFAASTSAAVLPGVAALAAAACVRAIALATLSGRKAVDGVPPNLPSPSPFAPALPLYGLGAPAAGSGVVARNEPGRPCCCSTRLAVSAADAAQRRAGLAALDAMSWCRSRPSLQRATTRSMHVWVSVGWLVGQWVGQCNTRLLYALQSVQTSSLREQPRNAHIDTCQCRSTLTLTHGRAQKDRQGRWHAFRGSRLVMPSTALEHLTPAQPLATACAKTMLVHKSPIRSHTVTSFAPAPAEPLSWNPPACPLMISGPLTSWGSVGMAWALQLA